MLSPEERAQLANPDLPISYLTQRAEILATALVSALAPPTWSRDTVDAAISLGERLRLVAVPLGTTVVPLAVTAAVERTGFTRTWTFPPGMLDTVAGFATLADNLQLRRRCLHGPDVLNQRRRRSGMTAALAAHFSPGVATS